MSRKGCACPVQVTWVVQRHALGVLRPMYPVLVWATDMELQPGMVLRIK